MKTSIISIGRELLVGQTINTNAAWLSRQLYDIGVSVNRVYVIDDREDEIQSVVKKALGTSDLVLTTGGLGPTKDDITKQTVTRLFDRELVRSPEVINEICRNYDCREKDLDERNRQQADIPEGSTPLTNRQGSAPGLWIEKEKKVVIVMPGVPREMKSIFSNEALPKIKNTFDPPSLYHKDLHTVGTRESQLAEQLEDFQSQLPESVSLAFLPKLGRVTLRLSGKGEDREQLQAMVDKLAGDLKEKLGNVVYGEAETTFVRELGELLKRDGLTLATAESCTGGYMGHQLTTEPGSSEYYEGSVISYSNAVKQRLLGVKKSTLKEHGAVSEPVVRQMARGVREKLQTDYGLADSGIAGPGGGTEEKPVGTIWFALAHEKGVFTYCFHFRHNRLQNIRLTTLLGLNFLRRHLLGETL